MCIYIYTNASLSIHIYIYIYEYISLSLYIYMYTLFYIALGIRRPTTLASSAWKRSLRGLWVLVSGLFLGPHLVRLRFAMLRYVPLRCANFVQPIHSDMSLHILVQRNPPGHRSRNPHLAGSARPSSRHTIKLLRLSVAILYTFGMTIWQSYITERSSFFSSSSSSSESIHANSFSFAA